MWICVNCGGTNADSPGTCEVCGHPRAEHPPATGREPPLNRWAPGFRTGPPPAPRNAPPFVTGRMVRTPHPEPAGPETVESRHRLVPALPIAVLVATLALAGVLAGPRLLRSAEERPAPPAPGSTVPATTPSTEPTTENATISLVSVDPAVTDPRATPIAAMLETYFASINEKDYAAVAGVFDPDGAIDPGDPEQMAAFSDGTATTEDSDVVLLGVTDLANGRVRADVRFRSEQEAGDGPTARPGETCTRWHVGYTLTTSEDGYRIFRGKGTSEPC